jgi:hypothetical protein
MFDLVEATALVNTLLLLLVLLVVVRANLRQRRARPRPPSFRLDPFEVLVARGHRHRPKITQP